MFEYLNGTSQPFIIVGTKCDKLNAAEKRKFPVLIENCPAASCAKREILFSSAAKIGRDELWREILKHALKQ